MCVDYISCVSGWGWGHAMHCTINPPKTGGIKVQWCDTGDNSQVCLWCAASLTPCFEPLLFTGSCWTQTKGARPVGTRPVPHQRWKRLLFLLTTQAPSWLYSSHHEVGTLSGLPMTGGLRQKQPPEAVAISINDPKSCAGYVQRLLSLLRVPVCECPGAQTRNSRDPGWGGGCPLSNGEHRHLTGIWR